MAKNIYDIISSGLGTDDSDVPISSKISQSADNNLDSIEFITTSNFQLDNLEEFVFYDFNGNIIFRGRARDNGSGTINTIIGFDYSIELQEILIRKNFEDMTPLEIIEDVITNYTGLTYVNPTTIIDGDTIKLYPSQNKTAKQIIEDMHKLLGTTHYTDNRNFNIEYEGEELNPKVLTVNSNCSVLDRGWTLNTSKLVKNITVNGGDYDTTETIYLSGDGSTKLFTINNPYVDITVEYPIGTELKPQLDNSTTGDYRVYKETKKIEFITIIPANASNNIKVTYTYKNQANFTVTEVTSTDVLSGTNPHHRVLNVEYLKEVIECKTFAEKYKNKFSSPLRTCKLRITDSNLNNYRANQRIRVIDNYHKVNGEYVDDIFLIKNITRGFGNDGGFIELDVGDSDQFVFDKAKEVSQKVADLNEKTPKAEIFNEGVVQTTSNNVSINIETEIIMKKATLPQNILLYNSNRSYINSTTTPEQNYKYIRGENYINLFEDIN